MDTLLIGAEVGEEVRVGVGVRVGPVEFKLNKSRAEQIGRAGRVGRCYEDPREDGTRMLRGKLLPWNLRGRHGTDG